MQRDLVGYGQNSPRVEWPGAARIAISLVVNYEEGSELSPLHGDERHETYAELESPRRPEMRNLMVETQWEYGARAGVWRLLRVLEQGQVKATFFISALALDHNPPLGPAIAAQGHDISGHGYRWVEQWHLDREAEKEDIHRAVVTIEKITGRRPLGWWTKAGPSFNTRDLLAEEGFLYDCDAVNDDLPYYSQANGEPWLVVPYALDSNDGKYWKNGWNTSDSFFQYLRDSFDVLYEEGATHPKMLSVGLHSRVSGRPGRAAAVTRFIQYAKGHPNVWFAGRDDVARWWLERYPPTR
ncbi:MAG TPA: polysaccharide deacetylase family protein [Chloroflexota bacterium]|nr:polysaccharide deacetylase family protein [Chloroflexota bacterium]